MDYRNLLLLALGLPETADDSVIVLRLAALAKAVGAAVDLKTEGVKAFSAGIPNSLDLVDAEVARQMGNSAGALLKYGTKTRA